MAKKTLNAEANESKRTNRRWILLKYIIMLLFSILWGFSAFYAIRDLWLGKRFFDSPWLIVSLLLTLVLVGFVIIPLFLELQRDIREIKKKKEEQRFNF